MPRWVARKSRPIIHKVATRIAANRRTLGSIAVPQWLRVASRAGSAAQAGGTHHGALKVQVSPWGTGPVWVDGEGGLK